MPLSLRERVAQCIRKVANISAIKQSMLLDAPKTFNPDVLRMMNAKAAPKLAQLLTKIKELDAKDMKTHGKHFKHMIFTDIDQSNYGAKLIASALVADGMHPAYTPSGVLRDDDKLLETKGANFGILISKPYGSKAIPVKAKKAMMQKFNQRPNNNT